MLLSKHPVINKSMNFSYCPRSILFRYFWALISFSELENNETRLRNETKLSGSKQDLVMGVLQQRWPWEWERVGISIPIPTIPGNIGNGNGNEFFWESHGMAIFPWEWVGMGMDSFLGILQYSQKFGNSGNGNEIRWNGNSHGSAISACDHHYIW